MSFKSLALATLLVAAPTILAAQIMVEDAYARSSRSKHTLSLIRI